MSQPTPSPHRNRLLAALSPDDLGLLQPHLDPVDLKMGDVLVEPNMPIEHVHFVEDGIASIVALTPQGRQLKVGLFGWDGVSGTAVVLGTDRTPHKSFIQVAGRAQRMRSEDLRRAVGRSPSLQALLLRYVQVFTIQTAHTALSNGSYKIEERLARWLLMCHDRIEGDELALTHEFLALMLGVRRPGVTDAANGLEGTGLIRARRGLIQVIDRAGLEEVAGESYGLPEAEYERLIGPMRAATASRHDRGFGRTTEP